MNNFTVSDLGHKSCSFIKFRIFQQICYFVKVILFFTKKHGNISSQFCESHTKSLFFLQQNICSSSKSVIFTRQQFVNFLIFLTRFVTKLTKFIIFDSNKSVYYKVLSKCCSICNFNLKNVLIIQHKVPIMILYKSVLQQGCKITQFTIL